MPYYMDADQYRKLASDSFRDDAEVQWDRQIVQPALPPLRQQAQSLWDNMVGSVQKAQQTATDFRQKAESAWSEAIGGLGQASEQLASGLNRTAQDIYNVGSMENIANLQRGVEERVDKPILQALETGSPAKAAYEFGREVLYPRYRSKEQIEADLAQQGITDPQQVEAYRKREIAGAFAGGVGPGEISAGAARVLGAAGKRGAAKGAVQATPPSGGSVPAVSAARSTAQPPAPPGQTPASAAIPTSRTSPQASGAVPPSGTPPSGPTIAQGASGKPPRTPKPYTPQGPTKEAGFREFWDRTRNVIAEQGPHGKTLADNLHESREVAERAAGDWVSRMPTVRNLTDTEFNKFVYLAEGKATTVDPVLNKALSEWSAVRDEIWNTATAAKLKVGKQQDYFPHIYEEGTFSNKQNFEQAAKHLIASGQAKNMREAEQIMYRLRDVARRRHGNLEAERVADLPGYKRDKDALFGYVESAAERIGQAQMFGPRYEKAIALLGKIRKTGFDDSAAKNAFDVATRSKLYGRKQEAVSRGLRTGQVVTKMGLSLIANATQTLNTAAVTGVGNSLKNMRGAFTSQADADYALKIGVTLDGVIKDLREGAGWQGKLGKVGAPGFNAVEKFNRTLAATAGREFAIDEAAKAAKGDTRALDKLGMLGLDGKAIAGRGGQLTQDEMDRAARSIVERTQFKVDPQDLPILADSPWGKVIMQFRTFSYNQTAFLAREVLEPAYQRKDYRPLMRYLLLAPTVGAASTEIRNLITNRRPEEDDLKRLEEYVSRVGGVGIVGDLIRGLFPRNVKYMDPYRYPSIVGGAVGGPTVSTAGEALTAGAQMALTGGTKGMERFLLGQVPVAGSTLRNTLTPYEPGGRSGSGGAAGNPLGKFMEKRQQTKPVRQFLKSRSR